MKLFFIPLPKNANPIYTCPRTRHMIRQGLAKIPEVEIVENKTSADFYVLDYVPHDGELKYNKDCLIDYDFKPLIVIDNSDEHDVFYTDDYHLYFKRSLWVTEGYHRKPSPSAKRSRVHWFDYGVLDEFIRPSVNKNIECACYLRPSCKWRSHLIYFLQQQQIVDTLGTPSNASRSTGFDASFDEVYFDYLTRTKLLYTCQPYGWVSDSRLYEALANKCLVFTDKIYIQHDYPFVHQEHLIEYNISQIGLNELVHNWHFLVIEKSSDTAKIAEEGHKYALAYHSSKARMQYTIKTIKDYY